MSDSPQYRLDRIFDAPREMVWRAWTNPEILQRWYGPRVETTIHKFDLRPGGVWLNEMRWGDKADYSKMAFQEVVEPEKLVWHHSSTDGDWNIIPNPMMKDWPRTLLTTVIFEPVGEQTRVCLTQVPLEASEAERACFAATMKNMDHGWGAGYAIMDEIFVELKADLG